MSNIVSIPATMAPQPEGGGGVASYLCFSLGNEAYAMALDGVREVLDECDLTPVPGMGRDSAVLGVLNLRGSVLPVLDLARHLGRQALRPGRRRCILVVEGRAGMSEEAEAAASPLALGWLVEAVGSTQLLDGSTIEPAPAFGLGLAPHCVLGIVRPQGRPAVLLDPARLLQERIDA